MKGDFTRWNFRPPQHYHGVLKQQGRVDLDSDWNEQGAITAHRIETEALDVIGASGAPVDDAGFMIQAASNGANLSISTGRAYVDGILCENDLQNLLITAQPDLPGFQLPTAAGTYIAYLEVWERHITSLDDSEILEVALGGPDTCTRAKTVWQVKLLDAGAVGANIDCSTDVPSFDTIIAPSTGTLFAQAQPTATTDPCMVPATAGYRSLENQLYRVEIHNAGTGDAVAGSSTATFKWSRDNGTVVSSWIAPPSGQNPGPNTLFVSSSGKDSVLGFAAGQWVELCDDTRELNFLPGTLVQLTNVQGQVLTVDSTTVIPAGGSLNLADYPLNPKVRRWDSAGVVSATTGSPINLENGVQVQFAAGTYSVGDYWLIPARTLTANIDWPTDTSNNPIPQLPKGIQRHYCRLAILQFDGQTWSLLDTCLLTFPPLTQVASGADKGIHITDVLLALGESANVELLNDSTIPLSLNQVLKAESLSIKVICDTPLDPVSVKPSTCLLTLDMPYPVDMTNLAATQPLFGFQTVILPVQVSVVNSVQIVLKLSLSTLRPLADLLVSLNAANLANSLMVHLTLKGDVIWGLNDPTLFLDGEGFGITRTDADGTTHIGLRLPVSGDGKRGGNFDMWFWFAAPVTLSSFSFAPSTISSGQSTTGTLTLSGPAPSGGAAITLTSNDPNVLGVLPAVTIQENQSSTTFTLAKTSLPAGEGSIVASVTATYDGGSVSASLTINEPVALTALTFDPTTVGPGATAKLTATLNSAAPTGGAVIKLTSNAAPAGGVAIAAVKATLTVPAGKTSVTVSVPTTQRGVNQVLKVTGTYNNSTAAASLTIK
jgi:hypothetical protein